MKAKEVNLLAHFFVLFLRFVSLKHDVCTVSMYGERVAFSLVESPLPQLPVGETLPPQAVACELGAAYVEDADLLSCERTEHVAARNWREQSVVGKHCGVDM